MDEDETFGPTVRLLNGADLLAQLMRCDLAARTCTQGLPEGGAHTMPATRPLKALDTALKAGHESVVEHCTLTFAIRNLSRVASHQLVRHRLMSASQQSLRYSAARGEFYTPVSFREASDDVYDEYLSMLDASEKIYRRFIEAVNVLPEGENVTITEADTAGRMDLRALPIFTIDSAETKDIDDAISLNQTPDGFELGVHIADVSNYVKPGTALDDEAFSRATSVYYADQVVPMLPKQLSNGICSLNEGELRLAFSCLMHLDKAGKLVDYKFVKSVIRSRVKGVYSEINALLAGTADREIQYKYAEVAAQLPAMKALYTLRAGLRRERGCMDIESGEVKLILDENGRCIDVKKRVQGESEAMIEEFMLLANQCAAHFARTKQIPFVYRVHEEPGSEKLERLHALLQACGINDHFAKEVPEPKELSAILEGVKGTPYEKIIHTGLLRCMSKAEYQPEPKGHYGLVLKDYAHFTSPIRRYPDLAIHRILTSLLGGMDKESLTVRYSDFAEKVSKQASAQEIVAMQIERKAEDCYKAEYARAHIGEHREGTISGVTQKGVFVELDNGVEGFVPVGSLTATGALLTEGVRLSDPVSGKQWALGDAIMITIVRADVNLGKIDFEAATPNA